MAESNDAHKTRKSWIDWKMFAGPAVGVFVTAVWGIIAMHFGVKELTNVVGSLRETVVDLRTTVNEMGRNTTDHEKKISLLEFRMGTGESQIQIISTSKKAIGN